MIKTEPINISVILSSKFWQKAPKAKVYVDNELICDKEITEKTKVNWSGNIAEGEHVLTVELYDKDKYQTVIEDDKIVKDQLLNIDSVVFDDIDIGYLKHSLSEYHPNNDTTVIKQCVNLGVNGKWELKFTTPIYIWLLENM